MPVDYFQPLNSLRSLSGSGFSPIKRNPMSISGTQEFDQDPDAQLLNLQNQRLDELKDNAAKGLIMAAPQNTQHELESDIASNPITKQGAQVNDYMDKSRSAQMSGFSTPQEEAAYTQRISEEKMRQPASIEAGKNQTEIEKQNIASKAAVDVANIAANAKDAQLEAFKTFITNRGIGGGPSHFGLPGGGSVSFGQQKPIPSALLMNVNKMRDAANKATGFMGYDPFGNKATAQANLKGAIATALSQHPAPPEIKDVAQRIANSQKFGKMPLQQILASGDPSLDLSDATPEEIDHLDDVLKIIRGF